MKIKLKSFLILILKVAYVRFCIQKLLLVLFSNVNYFISVLTHAGF